MPEVHPNVSQRMLGVQAPLIPVVGEMIAAHPGTISLGQGVAFFGPPPSVAEAVVRAASEPATSRYHMVRGRPELLQAIEAKLAADNGIEVDGATRVVFTAGANMAFLNAVLAVADPGDEILLPGPYYFNHEMAVTMAGCRPAIVATDENFQPDVEAIAGAITPRTRAVVTVSPNNPTGAVYEASRLKTINALCAQRGLYHVTDETYEYFVYGDEPHFSPGSIEGASAHTIGIWSLSKAYGMAGWRTAYMLIPAHLEEAVKKIQDTNLICPPIVCQVAAKAALEAGRAHCQPMIDTIAEVRGLVLESLSKLGDRCTVPRPDGAFYAMLRLNTAKRDMELVERLIADFGVAVMPGSTFGVEGGCCLRVAYGALDRDSVAEGIGRLVRGLEALL